MIPKNKYGEKRLAKNTMPHVALISFLTNSINTRSLSSYLRANGHEVTCYFCQGAFNERNLQEIIKGLKEKKMSLVGISLVTDDYYSAVVVTSAIKKELGVPVIWGGAHVNVKPDECLQHADMICLGEGEEALLDLVKNYAEGKFDLSTKNIWFKTENGIVRNELRSLEENLDKYPFPDFDLTTQFVMNEKGFENLADKHLLGEYSIITSRGCPYSCHYCYNSYRRKQFEGKGKYLRKRSIENVVEELSHSKRTFKGLKRVNFWDDSFAARSIEEFNEFRSLYTKNVALPFFALIEPMAFDFKKIEILKESGLTKLQIGIQSGSERVNKNIYNRHVSNRKVIDIAHFIKKLEIDATYDIIFNNPYETPYDVAETAKLFLQFPKPLSLQGYNLIFYPQTTITDRALSDNYISMKISGEDFSTIQGAANSPAATLGRSEVSNRFYEIKYRSHEKTYFNSVISLISSKYIPKWFMGYFARSESPFKRTLLKAFIKMYIFAVALKHGVITPRVS
jgi:radical SAM superfamily enzyme YgiQ (UPF0313 family)